MVAELIRPPYNRNGSKYTLLKTLLPLIPPHKIYVEVFAGSAVLFFNKPLAQVNILNDLDKDTIRGLDLLKHSSSDVRQYKQDLDTLLKIKKFFKKKAVSIEDKVLQRRIVSANGFGNKPVENESQIYKHSNPARHILKNLDLYQHYLKNARLYSEDYLAVLKKFDGPSTFFFLDPPYENTTKGLGYAQTTDFDFVRFARAISEIRGKFLVTINDSPYIRSLFKGFKIKSVDVPNGWKNANVATANGHPVSTHRKELIITNY